MADFRRIVLVLSVLAVFAGLASAQVGTQGLTCQTSAVVPNLRSEGLTEASGDVTLTCTGGNPTAVGTAIPQANFIIYLNTTITSRLLAGSSTVSEAILLIDEPESGEPGFGPALPQTACPSPNSGCPAVVGTWLGNTYAPVTCWPAGEDCTPAQAANLFFGLVSGNSVAFNGVPVLAPGTAANGVRVFRFTNIRANTAQITGGTLPGTVQDVISISSSTSITLNTYSATTGIVNKSLSTSVSASGISGLQCYSEGTTSSGALTFADLFPAAFKTRVSPLATGNDGNLQSALGQQNIPGQLYLASESDFTPYNGTTGVTYNGSVEPGLADYGTRLKAVFSNIPAGVNVFVWSTPDSNTTAGASAWLVPSETGGYSPVGAAGTWVELSQSGGTAIAVWEITATLGTSVESLEFPYAISYTSDTADSMPAVGTATVSLSYAPTATQGAFSLSAGAAASGTLTIPRFVDTSAASTAFSITLCATDLLFPFVTNQSGFDTGLSIANTSTDPGLGATPQQGTCTLNWYTGTTNPAPTVTSNVPSGTIWVGLASALVPGFEGYMIAVCDFQYAHGFAFVSDIHATNLAMGYLALILEGTSPFPTRPNVPGAETNAH